MGRKTKISSYTHIGHSIHIGKHIRCITKIHKSVPIDEMYILFHEQAVDKKRYNFVRSLVLVYLDW